MAQTHASDGGRSGRLAEEQAALRRAAAHCAEPSSLFGLVAEKVSRVLRVPFVSVVRFEDDRTATERASFSPEGVLSALGGRWSLVGASVVSEMRASGRAARIDDYTGLEGEIAEECRRVGIRSTVGIPVAVGGRTWGTMVVSSTDAEPLPADTESGVGRSLRTRGSRAHRRGMRACLPRWSECVDPRDTCANFRA